MPIEFEALVLCT